MPLTWEIEAKNKPLPSKQIIGLHPRSRLDVQPRKRERAAGRASGLQRKPHGAGVASDPEGESDFGGDGVGGSLHDSDGGGHGQPPPGKRQRDATAEAEKLAGRWREIMPKLIRRSIEATPAVWGGPLGGPPDAAVAERACECTSSQCCPGHPIKLAYCVPVDFVTAHGVATISVPRKSFCFSTLSWVAAASLWGKSGRTSCAG